MKGLIGWVEKEGFRDIIPSDHTTPETLGGLTKPRLLY